MGRAKSRTRTLAVNAILMAVAFALLGQAVWSNREELRKVLGRPIDGRLLLMAFAMYLAALLLTFYRWYILVRALDLPFRVRDAVRLGFIGNLFNLVIPGAVGGDVVKAAYLCREQARRTQAISSMVIDRAVGLLGLFLLAGAMGAGVWGTAGPDARNLIRLVWAAAASGLVGLAVLFTPALYRPLIRAVAGRPRLETFASELVAMAASYRRRVGVVVGMLVMASCIHALYVLAFYLVSRAIFPAGVPSLAQHFLMVPLVLFTTAVPIPFGALGVSEQVSDQLFGLVGHPGGAVAMMAYRVLMYGGGLVSLLVYLANIALVRDLSRDPESPEPDLVAAGP